MDENNKNGGQHADKKWWELGFSVLKQLFTYYGDLSWKKIANGYVDGLY